jgi:multidrug resistance efflux pump
VDGVISSIEVDTGDRVHAGQIIARLEDRHFTAKLQQARSQLQKARRELEVERLAIENERQRLSGSLREESADLAAARASVLASQSRADEAQRQLELQRSLASKGLVPAERVRSAETELRTAQALAAEARAAVAAAGAGEDLARVASRGISVREKRVSVLESDIGAYEAELSLAEANLEATVIRAPDDGAVVRRIVQPGGSIAVGQPVIAIWVGQQIWVEAWLDEDDLADVAVGSPAMVTFKSHPNREFAGVVETLGVSTDVELPDSEVPQPRQKRMRDTPVIGVRIRLKETVPDLFPGLSAVVAIKKAG